jgi:hypothetical protein
MKDKKTIGYITDAKACIDAVIDAYGIEREEDSYGLYTASDDLHKALIELKK